MTPASGIVSLTTDFGLDDPYVGLMKARILGRHPGARIIDLTHGITPHRPVEAGFWLERSRQHFPPGSVHVAVVDPGVGTGRGLLAVALDGQVFLAPDNGLLATLADSPGAEVRVVTEAVLARLGLLALSATFHGRDIFAPLAGEIASTRLPFEELGPVSGNWVTGGMPKTRTEHGRCQGEVILIDRFGNLFSNIEESSLKVDEVKSVTFGPHVLPLVRTYGEASIGAPVALVNAFGVIEAAVVEGRAADALGLGIGALVWTESTRKA